MTPQIKAVVAENPRNLKQAAAELCQEFSLPVTSYLLKQFLKKNELYLETSA